MGYCSYWNKSSDVNIKYHDDEWGVPLWNDRGQFEYLMLEVMQCGLNWDLVINKREIFRKCFDNFDYDLISKYTEKDIERIMQTEGMIKSEKKIRAVIHNAICFQKIRKEYGSFCSYIWQFSGNKTILYNKHEIGYIPSSNGLSDKIANDLKKHGFMFLGTITIYSHLQAVGIINDHGKDCPRYKYINANYPTIKKHRYLEKNVHKF
ncbi:MAG: DNA-3-methyladenine glycosylase I [bacterium]|nr:DNA-3-methyladenine glycosylase I [bacterium]